MPLNLLHAPEASFFVGRKDEFSRLKAALKDGENRHVVVLHGMGGIGKTQIALEFAKKYRDRYSAILWASARDVDSLRQSFLTIAKQIRQHHPNMNDSSPSTLDKIVVIVKDWLSLPGNHRWLLIFDSDSSPAQAKSYSSVLGIHNYFPDTHQGSIIGTTRRSSTCVVEHLLIRKLDDADESMDILKQAAHSEMESLKVSLFCRTIKNILTNIRYLGCETSTNARRVATGTRYGWSIHARNRRILCGLLSPLRIILEKIARNYPLYQVL